MSGNTKQSGQFTSATASSAFTLGGTKALLKVGGAFVGSVQFEIFNATAGAYVLYGQAITANAAQLLEIPPFGQQCRINCTSYTSGTIIWELEAPDFI